MLLLVSTHKTLWLFQTSNFQDPRFDANSNAESQLEQTALVCETPKPRNRSAPHNMLGRGARRAQTRSNHRCSGCGQPRLVGGGRRRQHRQVATAQQARLWGRRPEAPGIAGEAGSLGGDGGRLSPVSSMEPTDWSCFGGNGICFPSQHGQLWPPLF